MNRFIEAVHGLRVWLQLNRIDPKDVELILRFREPRDLNAAERALERETDPLLHNSRALAGNFRKGVIMDIPFRLESAGLHTPHHVAEELRRLAGEVDGDVCGPY